MTVAPPLRVFEFAFSSSLGAPAERVWAHATRLEGVNRELAPLARMTPPRAFASLDLENAPLGRRVFRSWILAFGFLPIDYDELTLVELEPGRRFFERSRMLTQRVWEHERVVEPVAGGCVLTDRVRFTPRVTGLGPVFRGIFRLTFRLRHRNLKRLFHAREVGE